MKISYMALGCKVNLYEAEALINEFCKQGYTLASFEDVCDVYLINTCTVTATSDSKSRKVIRQAIKRNPEAVVVVMGCYSKLNKEEVSQIEGVDVVLGTSNRHLAVSLVKEALENKKSKQFVFEKDDYSVYEELKIEKYNHKTRGFVKIEDGCDNYCSYCAIPYSRGPVRSRNKDNVIEEIKSLTKNNMKEIVLSGINTGAYGKDFKNYSFSDLLREIINNVPNLGRIRISSIEATEISDDFLKVLSENKDSFCKHFHIPLQGGSNNTLKRMNRKYDLNFYESRLMKIREIFPDVNITTDILAGFCGETEASFKESYEFINKMNYGEMHVFPYSKRKGTVAYNMTGHIEESIKHFRVNELLSLNNKKALEYRLKFVNKVVEALVEKNENGIAFGHTSNYLEVSFKSEKQNNELVKVKIIKAGYPISLGEENEF